MMVYLALPRFTLCCN